MSRILKLLIVSMAFIVMMPAWAQPNDRQRALIEEARVYDAKVDELLKLNATSQKDAIAAMPLNEAIAVKDAAVRRLAKSNIEASSVFYLYDHLASLQANDLAEKRLERLMAVFVITLLLFGSYLVYLMLSQNRTVRQLNSLLSSKQNQRPEIKKKQAEIYRGE